MTPTSYFVDESTFSNFVQNHETIDFDGDIVIHNIRYKGPFTVTAEQYQRAGISMLGHGRKIKDD